jgi:DNA-3-methyladenine glycosylase II
MSKTVSLFISPPALFSFEECLWFLDRNYDDCMHKIAEDRIYKALDTRQGVVLCCIFRSGEQLQIDILKGKLTAAGRQFIIAYVREWLHMDADIQPFYTQLSKVKKLAYMAQAFNGLRLPGINSLFEALCWSIIGQQINLAFAYKLKRRLVEAYGDSVDYKGAQYYIFPTYASIAAADVEALRAMQFSGQKTVYLIGLARTFENGEISKEQLLALPTLEDRQKALIALKGIGIWTANYSLMKSLRAPDSIPHGDAGLLQALVLHGIMKDRKDLAAAERLYKKFKGWESYLVFYLWRSLALK